MSIYPIPGNSTNLWGNELVAWTEVEHNLDGTHGPFATFSVNDYGKAVGNGIVDDTSAIQTTINAASAAGGGRVIGRPGSTFLLSVQGTATFGGNTPSYMLLMKTGVILDLTGCIITVPAYTSGSRTVVGAVSGQNNWAILNGSWNGNYSSATEVFDLVLDVGGCNNWQFAGNFSTSFGGKCVLINPNGPSESANNYRIVNNEVTHHSSNAFGPNYSNDWWIQENYIHDCQTSDGAEAILGSNLTFGTIARNRIVNWETISLCPAGLGHDLWVTDNSVSVLSTAAAPIRALDVGGGSASSTLYNVYINGNTLDITNSAATNANCINITGVGGGHDIEISGNTLIAGTTQTACIVAVQSGWSDVRIVDNRLIGGALAIDGVNVLSDSTISGNICDQPIEVASRNVIFGNKIVGTTATALVVVNDNQITGNYISTLTPALSITGSRNVATGNEFITTDSTSGGAVQVSGTGSVSNLVAYNQINRTGGSSLRHIFEVNVPTSANYYMGNVLLGTTPLVSLQAGSPSVLRDNFGYNPVGVVVVAVPLTTASVAAANYDRTFYITNGAAALTCLIQNGPSIVIPASTSGTIRLPAQKTMSYTYASGTPTQVVEGE